jgi:hypothetical protein
MHSKNPNSKILLDQANKIIKKENLLDDKQENIVRRTALKLLKGKPKNTPKIDKFSSLQNRANPKLNQILKLAAFFSEESLINILGSELYKIAKPIGYADKKRTTILIKASSSANMQEIYYRKKEILSILKQTSCFNNIERIKIIL